MKKNVIFNILLTVSSQIIAILTFPYISRVLGVEKIGEVNYIDGFINYAITLSTLGIVVVGVREVAASKTKEEIIKTFSGLLTLNIIFTIATAAILIFFYFFLNKFERYSELVGIGLCKLFFNLFLVEWFFKGLKDFKYIAIRSIIIKVVYAISLFIFVKDQDDYILYYGLTTGAILINVFVDWNYILKKYTFRLNFNFLIFVKPYISFGVYMLLSSLYTSFNVIYLGWISNTTEVGFYTTATKLYGVILGLFSAFTAVMLPQMTTLLSNNDTEEFKNKISQSTDLLILFSFPVIVISIVFTPEIIFLLSGKGYEGAIWPMRIMLPLVFIIGYEQILIIQTLMPLKKDKQILYNSIIGAILGISLNLLLVPLYKSLGSSIVWVVCELVIMLISQFYVKKYLKIGLFYNKILKEFIILIPIIALIIGGKLFLSNYFDSNLIFVLLSIFTFSYYFIIKFYIFKSEILVGLIHNFLKIRYGKS